MSGPNKRDNRQIYNMPGSGIAVSRDGTLKSVSQTGWENLSESDVESTVDFETLTNQLANGDVPPELRDKYAHALKNLQTQLTDSDTADVAEVRENLYELRTAPPKIRTDLKSLIELAPDASQAVKIMARQLLR